MPTTLETIRPQVANITGEFPFFTNDNEVAETQIDQAIDQAMDQYSEDEPLVVVEDELGDGGHYYPLTSLASWENDFSQILEIDYDSASRVTDDSLPRPISIDDGDIKFYRDATTRYLLLKNHLPDSTITFRVTYTARHILNGSSSTIPLKHEIAVVYLAASELASIVQFHVEKGLDSPVGAQYTTFRNRGSGFAAIAEVYLKKYQKRIGSSGSIKPASVVKDFDLVFLDGRDYFFHSRRNR